MAKKKPNLKGKPWDRITGESVKNYSRFLLFRNLGPERTSAEAYRLCEDVGDGHPSGTWQETLRRDDWKQRAEAWDHSLFEEAEEVWRQRGIDRIEKLWVTSQRLLERAAEILEMKIGVTVDEDGDLVEGLEVTFRDGAYMAKVSADLSERAMASRIADDGIEGAATVPVMVIPDNLRAPMRGEDMDTYVKFYMRTRSSGDKDEDDDE